MKTDFLILGGGVAGLSAANYLAEAGAQVTLLESGSYPAHKICGEFISPEALPILNQWGIDPPRRIHRLKLVSTESQWQMDLPDPAGSCSRYFLDEALAKRAQKMGAAIQTGAPVKRIEFPKISGQPYVVCLHSGEKFTTHQLLLSAGRLVSSLLGQPSPPRYIGVKAHFQGIDLKELLMNTADRGYFGVSPIENGRVNVAGIIAATAAEIESPRKTFDAFFRGAGLQPLHDILASGEMAYPDWLVGVVPEFGVRPQPGWPGVYMLGDAAGVIAPATGDGLAMGVTSGVLAASCALKGEDQLYRKYWNRAYKRRIAAGKILHHLFLSPKWVNAIPALTRIFPFLPKYFFSSTRGTSLNNRS